MSGDVAIWPAEAPKTLWNYDLLRPAVERPYPLPLMGKHPDLEFVGYYAVGVLIILLFAWRRFDKRTFDPSSDDYLVLKELSPTELRGPSKMLQAYLYYAVSLVLIYSAFAFFGTVIFEALKSANIAGLQVDIDPASFADRNWPITLALALAGLTELFKPLDTWEAWLRRLSHRWVGIPIRVKARTEKLLRYLDKKINLDPSDSREEGADAFKQLVPAWLDRLPEWALLFINKRIGLKRLKQKFVQLRLMTDLVKEPGTWPDLALLEKVKPLAKRVYGDAEIAMQQLEDVLVTEGEQRLSDIGDGVAAGVERPTTKEQPAENSQTGNPGQSGSSADGLSEAARKRRQQLTVLEGAIDRVEKSRRETGALLAVYAERDEKRDKLDEKNLVGEAIRSAFPFTRHVNTGFWILMLLVPIFTFYTVMTWLGVHGLLGNVKPGLTTVLATALCETLRNAAIFLLPLTVVLGVRSYLKDSDQWHPISLFRFGPDTAMECVLIIAVGSFVAAVSLIAIAMGWIALIAENPDRFRTVLFSGKVPFAIYTLSYYFPSIASVVITTWAIDSLEWKNVSWKPWVFGAGNAVVVLLLMTAQATFWGLAAPPPFPISLPALIYSQLDLTDFIVYALIAFLSAGLFALPSDSDDKESKKTTKRANKKDKKDNIEEAPPGTGTGGLSVAPQASVAIIALALISNLAFPHPVHAGGHHCSAKLKMLNPASPRQLVHAGGQIGAAQSQILTVVPYSVGVSEHFGSSGSKMLNPVSPDPVQAAEQLGSAKSKMLNSALPHPLHAGEKSDKAKPGDARTVYLGVRYDAEPFSYLSGTGRDGFRSFRGYSTDLCYQLFDSSKYDVVLVPVTASRRFDLLRTKIPEDGDWAKDRKVDVLCEATTLRFDRRKEHDKQVEQIDGIFSPLTFVSGVSYLLRSSRQHNAHDIYLAYVEGTTAERVVSLACRNDMFALYEDDTQNQDDCDIKSAFVDAYANGYRDTGSIISPPCNLAKAVRSDDGHYHVCSFPSHDDLIAWFCNIPDKVLSAKIAYFGDREIIESKLESAQAKGQCSGTEPEKSPTTYTYEPYALLISKADPDLVQFVQKRVYEFFSHRNKATSLFATYFPGAQMSPVLAYLFLLNSIDEEKYYQVPYLENAQVADTSSRQSTKP